jgi:hypothetical protein
MKFLKIFSFLLSLMLLSCSSSSDGDGEVTISCSPTRIDVPAKGGTYKIMIVASEGGWEAREGRKIFSRISCHLKFRKGATPTYL